MTMARIAITGATGFIGMHLTRHLLQSGCTLQLLTRTPREAETNIVWINGDLSDEAAVALLLADTDLLVHLAGTVRGSTRADFDAVNVVGTRHVARAAAQAGVSRVLTISSLAAREPELSHYAASKYDGEGVLRQYFAEATVLRPAAVYGPGDRELTPLFDLMRNGIAPMPTHRGRVSLIYVDDLVEAIAAWVRSDLRGGTHEIHDGTVDGYSWSDLRAAVAEVTGRRSVRLPVPRAVLRAVGRANVAFAKLFGYAPMISPGKVNELFHDDWVVGGTEFEGLTGWRPQVDLRAGLAVMFGAR